MVRTSKKNEYKKISTPYNLKRIEIVIGFEMRLENIWWRWIGYRFWCEPWNWPISLDFTKFSGMHNYSESGANDVQNDV